MLKCSIKSLLNLKSLEETKYLLKYMKRKFKTNLFSIHSNVQLSLILPISEVYLRKNYLCTNVYTYYIITD